MILAGNTNIVLCFMATMYVLRISRLLCFRTSVQPQPQWRPVSAWTHMDAFQDTTFSRQMQNRHTFRQICQAQKHGSKYHVKRGQMNGFGQMALTDSSGRYASCLKHCMGTQTLAPCGNSIATKHCSKMVLSQLQLGHLVITMLGLRLCWRCTSTTSRLPHQLATWLKCGNALEKD